MHCLSKGCSTFTFISEHSKEVIKATEKSIFPVKYSSISIFGKQERDVIGKDKVSKSMYFFVRK